MAKASRRFNSDTSSASLAFSFTTEEDRASPVLGSLEMVLLGVLEPRGDEEGVWIGIVGADLRLPDPGRGLGTVHDPISETKVEPTETCWVLPSRVEVASLAGGMSSSALKRLSISASVSVCDNDNAD